MCKGGRLERGSPGHSSEVISPEILKMRAALFCIFTYLDTKTLLRAAEVCKDWKFVARHPAVWTRVLLENARVSSKVRGQGRGHTHSLLHVHFHIILATFVHEKKDCVRVRAWWGVHRAVPRLGGTGHHSKYPPPVTATPVPQFLAMLSQWCTQMHSLTLQNLKPRQRGKKESKEDYMKSTR